MYGVFSVNVNTSTKKAQRLIDEAIKRDQASPSVQLALKSQHSTKKAQRLVDEAIKRDQASPSVQLALKSQQNTFAPISRLPTEILCEIFSLMKIIEPHGVYRVGGKPPLQWFKVTWISRHWRNVAIGSPSLWIDPPLGHLPCVEQMLVRSKNSGLLLDACLAYNLRSFIDPGVKIDLASEDSSFPGLKLALQHSQRVEQLSLDIDLEQWQEVQKVLPKVAPRLECLRLTCCNVPAKLNAFASREILSDTPKLRRLELTGFELNWNTHSHLLHALTHLELDHFSLKFQMTWRQFSDALKQMPDLQVLCLSNALPLEQGTPVSWTSTYLASLQKLTIRCGASQVETLFSCIDFPPTTTLKIECPVTSSANAYLASLLIRIGHLYSNKLDTYFRSLILLKDSDQDRPYGAVYGCFGNEQMFDHDNIPAFLECTFSWDRNHEASKKFTKTMNDFFGRGIPLQDISHVYLEETLYALKPDILANTIGKLSSVRSVVTSRGTGRVLVDAMELGVGTHDENPSSHAPLKPPHFQNLTTICFHWMRFRAPYKRQREMREDDPDYVSAERLNNCLIQRSESGMGLTKLTFRRCRRMLKADVVLFRKVVGDVDWDGLRLD
ncbi:hypothetical protein BJ912DRAFT_933810 [Pholiota molesta]|nr:hypothetical protein BJ912DRAFT_933810 [Pholiota molesta]